jgi:hypothetical protein
MRALSVVLVLVLSDAALALAGDRLEISGFAGFTFPFYSQTFTYDPGSVTVPIPGVSVTESGQFALTASGGAAFAGAITFYATSGLGFEFRVDHSNVTIDTQGGSYTVHVGLPPPLDPVIAKVSLTQGTADVGALTPLSFNLKLRSGGKVRLTTSFGASKLGNIDMTLTQSVGLGVIGFDFGQGSAQIATLGVKASAVGGTASSWGGNLGIGLQIPIGEHVAFQMEGRGFYFPKRTVEWEPVIDRPLTDIEKMLLERLQQRLPSVEFEPWWVQATIGLAVRF